MPQSLTPIDVSVNLVSGAKAPDPTEDSMYLMSGARTPDPTDNPLNSVGHGQSSPFHPVTSVSQARAAVPQPAMIIAINPDRVMEVRNELAARETALVEVHNNDDDNNSEESSDPTPDKSSAKSTCLFVLLCTQC